MKFDLSQEHRDLGAATRGALSRLGHGADQSDDVVDAAVRSFGWADSSLDHLSVGVLAEEAGRALLQGTWWIMLSVGRVVTSVATATPALCLAAQPAIDYPGGDGRLHGTLHDVFGVANPGQVGDSGPQQLLFPSPTGVIGIDLSDPAVTISPHPDGLDPSRPSSTVHLEGAKSGPPGASNAEWEQAQTRANALLAAEATGVAQAMLDLAVDHAKARSQFGKPIGMFQAVAHPLADCFVDVELARSSWWWAMATLDSPAVGSPMREQAVATASVLALRCLETTSSASLQTLGAVGFTQEHIWHRYYRRAMWIRGYLAGRGPWQVLTAGLTKTDEAQGNTCE